MQRPVRSYRFVTVGLLSVIVSGAVVSGERDRRVRDGRTTANARGHVFLNDPSDGPYREVELLRLHGDASRLEGEFVRVFSARLHQEGESLESRDGAGDFRFEPILGETSNCTREINDCSPFDLVNVYYHVDRFAREFWMDRLGVEIDFQAHAVTHLAGDGAIAVARENTIKFRLGYLFMKNAALEDEIIYHEYTHLVTWHLGFRVDTDSPTETRALNEGIAHYFAASYTDDPQIGEWLIACPDRRECIGPPNAPDLVRLDTEASVWNWNDGSPASNLQYGVCTRFHEDDGKCKTSYNNFDSQYVWAIIWASALWDLTRDLGSEVVDRLLVYALGNANPFWTFAQALDGLLHADATLYEGMHADTIRNVFGARGIQNSVQTSLEEHEDLFEASQIGAGVMPNPSYGETHVNFHTTRRQRVHVAVFDVLGRRAAIVTDAVYGPGAHSLSWNAAHVPAGHYRVVVSSEGKFVSFPLVVVR